MEPSANGPMGAVEATPMSKYGKKLKSFRKVALTSFLSQNDRYGILSNFGLWKFFRKMLLKLVNWQLVLISRKINFVYERMKTSSFHLSCWLNSISDENPSTKKLGIWGSSPGQI